MPISELNEIRQLIVLLKSTPEAAERVKIIKNIKLLANNLNNEKINQLFFKEKENLNNLFMFTFDNQNINTDYNLMQYSDSYQIFQKIFSSFANLKQIFDVFNEELRFIFSDKNYESFQILSLKSLIEITKKSFLGLNKIYLFYFICF